MHNDRRQATQTSKLPYVSTSSDQASHLHIWLSAPPGVTVLLDGCGRGRVYPVLVLSRTHTTLSNRAEVSRCATNPQRIARHQVATLQSISILKGSCCLFLAVSEPVGRRLGKASTDQFPQLHCQNLLIRYRLHQENPRPKKCTFPSCIDTYLVTFIPNTSLRNLGVMS